MPPLYDPGLRQSHSRRTDGAGRQTSSPPARPVRPRLDVLSGRRGVGLRFQEFHAGLPLAQQQAQERLAWMGGGAGGRSRGGKRQREQAALRSVRVIHARGGRGGRVGTVGMRRASTGGRRTGVGHPTHSFYGTPAGRLGPRQATSAPNRARWRRAIAVEVQQGESCGQQARRSGIMRSHVIGRGRWRTALCGGVL
jgi:hypothetical protein